MSQNQPQVAFKTDAVLVVLAVSAAALGAAVGSWPSLALSMATVTAFLSAVISARLKRRNPTLSMTNTPFNDQMLAQCPSLLRPYNPVPMLGTNGHVETILASLYRNKPHIKYYREVIRMPDSGSVSLDYLLENGRRADPAISIGCAVDDPNCPGLPADAPLVIFLPGLTGGSQDSYVKWMAMESYQLGFRPVVFNARGCADSPVTSAQFYSAGYTEDMRNVVKLHKKRYPRAPIMAVGWSLGANILVNYVAEEEEGCMLSSAVSLCNPFDLPLCNQALQVSLCNPFDLPLCNQALQVSLCNPFDLPLCNQALQEGFARIYDKSLSKKLGSIIATHRMLWDGIGGAFDVDRAVNCKDIREFDDAITRVSFGFATVDDYYATCSSGNKIDKIKIPLLCIQAEDDPISLDAAIPRRAIEANPNCVLVTTPTGGHLGWTAGERGPFNAPWTDKGILEWLIFSSKVVGVRGQTETAGLGKRNDPMDENGLVAPEIVGVAAQGNGNTGELNSRQDRIAQW
eukprot:CAMPEP_0198228596 /NCGR_PEP_ID=MMETSP1445-20131203/113677_1 /TAXON_ID=36898 /ORGANISM="Pyramimonas sp., Strain CCMP2087" /LENGTH=514 /DNA_ID=CAMNT_0043909001 /DNA_START=303 /DNA_END=1847 /DNA_ORIENTATION=+